MVSDENNMDFALKIIDICGQDREKYNSSVFIIGYRLLQKEPYDIGIIMT